MIATLWPRKIASSKSWVMKKIVTLFL